MIAFRVSLSSSRVRSSMKCSSSKSLDGVEEIQVVLLYVRLSLLIVPVEFHQAQQAACPVEYRKLGESVRCMYVGIYKPFP